MYEVLQEAGSEANYAMLTGTHRSSCSCPSCVTLVALAVAVLIPEQLPFENKYNQSVSLLVAWADRQTGRQIDRLTDK